MPDIWGDRGSLARNRKRNVAGASAVGSLRAPILRSWQRCQSLGISPDLLEPPYQPHLDLEGRVYRAAGPVLDRLASEVADTRVAVVLADGQGVVLHRAGDKALCSHLDAVRLASGFNYAERYVGTNGIGTALEERQDFHVFGTEHFATSLQPFVTTGATIRDPLSGRVEGVVGLACWCPDVRQAMEAMETTVREAAVAIERRLLEQCTERERSLLREFLQVRGVRGPVPAFGQSTLPSGDAALTANDEIILRDRSAELISEARDAAVHVPLSRGRLATLVCQPVNGLPGEGGVVVKVSLPADPVPEHKPPGKPAPPRPENAASCEPPDQGGGAPAEWLLTVGEPGVGRLAVAARERLELLHDAGLRIGTTLEVTRTAEELAEMVVPRFADAATVDLLEPVLDGEEPVTANAAIHRAAVGARHAASPFHPAGTRVSFASSAPQARCFANGQAVLERDLKAVSEWLDQDRVQVGKILEHGFHSLISVPLRARGVVLGVVSLYRSGGSRPFEEDDLNLAEELIARVAMCIDNDRQYQREHTIALTLQRSLLPRTLPEQSAVEVAYRYLPAQMGTHGSGGVGGDWFDVIPLSGARVALVIGDVVGHGLHAAVTMGRLRTAVHNFSSLDLSPDELLGRLDDVVVNLDREDAGTPGGGDVIGATCVYAIYDPVSQLCTLARAGHPVPAVVQPDGAVEFPDVPAGPPLGLGGLPFQTAEFHLREGSRLVFYTDGLIEDRNRDLDVCLEELTRVLAHPDRHPEQICEAVLDALQVPNAADDVTLLVARTRALEPGRVAGWDVPADPAAVSAVRTAALEQLSAWGLDECAFTVELVLSELVTNAIRHAGAPIRVRLLRDRALICEVSDASSTSPHLRVAEATDEGGRGLFLVAQLAARWGTRYTARGKVIWAEQPLIGTR